MAIRIKTDLEWGQVFYLKQDPDQLPHELVGIVYLPGNVLRFRLDYMGEQIEVYDFQVSTERDELKVLSSENDDE